MATNKYFNRVSHTGEQDLFESQVIEAIQINGVDIWYIPREIFELDPILKEPKKTIFRNAYEIEAYMPDGGQFGGQQNIMTNLGFRINQTTELIISKKRFAELGTGRIRPREGDLIYIGNPYDGHNSFINQMMEINQVWYTTPDWQFGRHFTYRLVCESFTNSYEKFETGKESLDAAAANNALEVALGINDEVIEAKKPLVFDKNNPFYGM